MIAPRDATPVGVRDASALGDLVTVAVVPRERWSAAAASLRSVLAHTPAGVPLVHVDGGSPPEHRRRLARMLAHRSGVTRLRFGEYLAPNHARNLAAAHAKTPYVAFVDNDVLVARGWLEALVACAEATGAFAVGPLCLQGPWREGEIHLAGGDARIEETAGVRRLVERQEHLCARVKDVGATLARRPTELAEFHAILVRRGSLAALGGLDERLLSFGEHTDFCLRAREAGGTIWFEPSAVVTYLPPTRLLASDLSFFVARWSAAWNRVSLERLAERWGLPIEDPRLVLTMDFAEDHRRGWLQPWSLGHLLAKRPRRLLRRALDRWASPWLLARARGLGTEGLGMAAPAVGAPGTRGRAVVPRARRTEAADRLSLTVRPSAPA